MQAIRGLYVRHPSSFQHDTGGHPENARRLTAIEEAMSDRDWLGLELVEAPAATREQLERVHGAAHVDSIEALSARGGGPIDLDTVTSAGSWEAALHSAGGAVHATERLLADGGFAFCGLRPPGHHAERDRAMGFCLFNNVAVAAAHAIAACGVERVLVLDWDVHHGNGTESIFYGSSEVLYASIHQSPLYPGTGAATDLGSGEGQGYTANLPVPPGSGPDEFLALVQHVVAPIAREWRPGLLCISAGYDAHRDDPLANCELDDAAYWDMAATMRDLAGELGAPLLICLEGGYALAALARSVVATLDAVSGGDGPREAPSAPAAAYRERLTRFWPALTRSAGP
ncbi:MAG TPA: histone deacetylase [Solirubrobacterales bacterium]|nr:histone deacetylase [Solirubrobacterales bacterium]